MTTLSETMVETLRRARKEGGLVRMPGGFWTTPELARTATWRAGSVMVPDWWIGSQTVTALLIRGLLARGLNWKTVNLTASGRVAGQS